MLHSLVQSGKDMQAAARCWQFAEMSGRTVSVNMQDEYSLLHREEVRRLPDCYSFAMRALTHYPLLSFLCRPSQERERSDRCAAPGSSPDFRCAHWHLTPADRHYAFRATRRAERYKPTYSAADAEIIRRCGGSYG